MSRRYRLEFLVKAESWQEVVGIFKNELNLTTGKQDASDREISGTFLVHIYLDSDEIDSDFYRRVAKSANVALSYDPKGSKIRNEILDYVCIVEHQLRKLLLNISDVVENYFLYFDGTLAKDFAKSGSLVRVDDANPVTSYLTLDDAIKIFSLDLSSWHNKNLSANDLAVLLGESKDLKDLKMTLEKKMTTNTIWHQVDKHIIKKGIEWEDIKIDLNKLRAIRNKAAHFRIVTLSDLESVKTLSKKIDAAIKPARESTKQDLSELQRFIDHQAKILSELTKSNLESMLSISSIVSPRVQEALNTLHDVTRTQSYQQAIANATISSKAAQEALKHASLSSSTLEDLYKNLSPAKLHMEEEQK